MNENTLTEDIMKVSKRQRNRLDPLMKTPVPFPKTQVNLFRSETAAAILVAMSAISDDERRTMYPHDECPGLLQSRPRKGHKSWY